MAVERHEELRIADAETTQELADLTKETVQAILPAGALKNPLANAWQQSADRFNG